MRSFNGVKITDYEAYESLNSEHIAVLEKQSNDELEKKKKSSEKFIFGASVFLMVGCLIWMLLNAIRADSLIEAGSYGLLCVVVFMVTNYLRNLKNQAIFAAVLFMLGPCFYFLKLNTEPIAVLAQDGLNSRLIKTCNKPICLMPAFPVNITKKPLKITEYVIFSDALMYGRRVAIYELDPLSGVALKTSTEKIRAEINRSVLDSIRYPHSTKGQPDALILGYKKVDMYDQR